MSLANEIIYGTKAGVEYLIQQGADIEEMDEYGFTPLIEAAIVNNVDIARLLIEQGAEINRSDATGRTALHWATDNNNAELCELLLAHKADPNAYTTASQPILVYPLLRRNTEVKKLLYQYGAELNFAQDFISAKLLGHRYELEGQIDIVNAEGNFIELNYEGFFLEVTLDIVCNSLERYRNNFSARHFRTYFGYLNQIIRSFKIASELIKYQRYNIDIRQYAEQIDFLLNQQLLLIPVAYEGHAVTFIKYQNLLIRCDRGEFSKREGTVVVYQIGKLHLLNFDFIKQIIYKRQSKEFINEGIKQYLDLKIVEQIPVESQLIGNCSWANVEASIPAMLFLLQLNTDNSPREIHGYKTAALNFYRDWLQWDKDRALEDCLKSFPAASKARKASKAAMLGAVLFQKCNYQIPRDLEKAEKIINVLTTPEYLYVLKSYIKIYWQDRKTMAGENLMQLLDDAGVKIN